MSPLQFCHSSMPTRYRRYDSSSMKKKGLRILKHSPKVLISSNVRRSMTFTVTTLKTEGKAYFASVMSCDFISFFHISSLSLVPYASKYS